MVSVYRESDLIFHPEFVAYNINDTIVQLFAKINLSEFLYERKSDENFRSVINIHAEIIESYESAKIIDSTSKEFSFELAEKQNAKVISLFIPLKVKGKFLIHCHISDVNKGAQEEYFINLDRLSKPSSQDFLLLTKNNEPYFRNYFSANDSVQIIYNDSLRKNFFVNFYHRNFPLAYPPFSFDVNDEFDYREDSIFTLDISKGKICFPKEGFYQVQIDTSIKDGLSIFRFTTGFPDITYPRQMIEPLRYLTNKKEFEEIYSHPSPKAIVDNFWLTHGGNEEKSRTLIRKYYGRVRDANKYFTSFTEGWRTDRGMIYVIFGLPTTIHRGSESETWTYGTPNSSLSLSFFFVKVKNPFTENDFTLNRSPSYESTWFRAVEIWRQGRAYNSFY